MVRGNYIEIEMRVEGNRKGNECTQEEWEIEPRRDKETRDGDENRCRKINEKYRTNEWTEQNIKAIYEQNKYKYWRLK